MPYRLGGHHKDTAYWQPGEEPEKTDRRAAYFFPAPRDDGEAGGEEWLAAAFVAALNATMDGCTCPLICRACGNVTGRSAGCEPCYEHHHERTDNGEG